MIGTNSNDTLNGSSSADVLIGGGGADTINGNAGADTITGGAGKDTMTGGADADTFVFIATANSPAGSANRDVITDFLNGADKIDLSAIDANSSVSLDQAFLWGGLNVNTVANSVTWSQDGVNTIVRGDVNGDAVADFEIQLNGLHSLNASDFIM